MGKVKEQNESIKDYVKNIIEKQERFLEFNKKIILMMKAYKFKIEQELEKNFSIDVTEEMQLKIKKDLEKFKGSFLNLQVFRQEEDVDLQLWENKLSQIENFEVVQDYAKFIGRMIYCMDNCNSERAERIDASKFDRIKDLLERDENLGPDEIAVVSYLYWDGSKLNKDKGKATELLSKAAAKKDERCRIRKYWNG